MNISTSGAATIGASALTQGSAKSNKMRSGDPFKDMSKALAAGDTKTAQGIYDHLMKRINKIGSGKGPLGSDKVKMELANLGAALKQGDMKMAQSSLAEIMKAFEAQGHPRGGGDGKGMSQGNDVQASVGDASRAQNIDFAA